MGGGPPLAVRLKHYAQAEVKETALDHDALPVTGPSWTSASLKPAKEGDASDVPESVDVLEKDGWSTVESDPRCVRHLPPTAERLRVLYTAALAS